jgi:hypothetical protein
MTPTTMTQRASEASSGQSVVISPVRHPKRGGLMMAILGSRKQVLRQPRLGVMT